MSFKKLSAVQILGLYYKRGWHKSSNRSIISHYMENKLAINLEERLDAVADFYKISRDPNDYLLIPARANSVGRLNANLDGWTYPETVSFRPDIGCRTYETYNNKPHFVEHNASSFERARGVILDSHLNLDNDADDQVKQEVLSTIGVEPQKDVFVEVIVAMDQTKDPILAASYKTGAISTFSMGADVESTGCTVCGNVAKSIWEFCSHIKDKYADKTYTLPDGTSRRAGELCNGTVFQELSVVSDPADKSAEIQDGILEIAKRVATNSSSLSKREVQEIISFTARHANDIPDSLARVLNYYLSKGLKDGE